MRTQLRKRPLGSGPANAGTVRRGYESCIPTRDLVDREFVLVIKYISTVSYAINCYIIIPGAVYFEKMFNNNLLLGTKISCNKKGYLSDELVLEWL